jgi:hypothetical protein
MFFAGVLPFGVEDRAPPLRRQCLVALRAGCGGLLEEDVVRGCKLDVDVFFVVDVDRVEEGLVEEPPLGVGSCCVGGVAVTREV